MKYLAALTALSLLASTAAFAQSDQSKQPQQQPSASSNDNQSSTEQEGGQQPQLSQQFVRQLQRRLQQQGVFQGQPSGTWDQETADAIEQFQQDHDIQPSGQIDGATLMALLRARPVQQQQQGVPEQAIEGSSSANGSSSRPTGASPMLHAYQHGYQQGFEQGFEAALQQLQQQQ